MHLPAVTPTADAADVHSQSALVRRLSQSNAVLTQPTLPTVNSSRARRDAQVMEGNRDMRRLRQSPQNHTN
jgi:hypothetical protein